MWFHANPRRPAGANGRIGLAKGSRSRLNLRFLERHGGGMRAVVTGGAGFLGSHLCDRLLAEGWEVLALDNLITGSEANITHLSGNPKFRYEKKDVTEPLRGAGEGNYIFHFALPASPPDYLKYPIETLN